MDTEYMLTCRANKHARVWGSLDVMLGEKSESDILRPAAIHLSRSTLPESAAENQQEIIKPLGYVSCRELQPS